MQHVVISKLYKTGKRSWWGGQVWCTDWQIWPPGATGRTCCWEEWWTFGRPSVDSGPCRKLEWSCHATTNDGQLKQIGTPSLLCVWTSSFISFLLTAKDYYTSFCPAYSIPSKRGQMIESACVADMTWKWHLSNETAHMPFSENKKAPNHPSKKSTF